MRYYSSGRACPYFVILAVILSLFGGDMIQTQAASKYRLNKKKLTLEVGETFVLKVRGSKKRVKWSSSRKKIATVAAKGKKKGKVKARRVGSCRITARVGKKKMVCRVRIKRKSVPVPTQTPATNGGVTGVPGNTSQPVQNDNTGTDKPDVPVNTNNPDEPGAPMVTIKPGVPVVTGNPEVPVVTDKPGVPVSTDKPGVPVSTDKPEVPVVTDKPDVPVSTDKPEVPTSTDKPDNPAGEKMVGLYDEELHLVKSWEELVTDEEADVFEENGEVIFGYYGCREAGILYVPESVTTIAESAFSGCTALQGVVFQEGLLEIGANAFEGCMALKTVKFGSGLETIGESAFAACENLESVEFAGDKLVELKRGTFSECSSLLRIEIPPGVNTIGEVAFDGCTSLQEVILPESLSHIEAFAFADCSNVGELDVPDSVVQIGELAFLNVPHINYHGVLADKAEETGMWGAVAMN